MERQEAEDIVRSASVVDPMGVLLTSLEPSIRISAEKTATADIPLGASRFGGVPDLRPGFEWPWWNARRIESFDNEKQVIYSNPFKSYLHFLAQIRLEDMPDLATAHDLPASGTLYFFYDAENLPYWSSPVEKGAWRVFFCDAPPSDLVRAIDSPLAPEFEMPSCEISFSRVFTIDRDPVETLEPLDDGSGNDIFAVIDPVQLKLHGNATYHDPIHRMFGHEDGIQGNDMRLACEAGSRDIRARHELSTRKTKALEKRKVQWSLLLQIDTTWLRGDNGMVYFWIKDRDLRRRRFDRTWFYFDCS